MEENIYLKNFIRILIDDNYKLFNVLVKWEIVSYERMMDMIFLFYMVIKFFEILGKGIIVVIEKRIK